MGTVTVSQKEMVTSDQKDNLRYQLDEHQDTVMSEYTYKSQSDLHHKDNKVASKKHIVIKEAP